MIGEAPAVCWLFATAQVVGLAVAWIARLSFGSRRETFCCWLFLACLPLVGGVAAISIGLGPECWLIASTALSLMILTVTCDFRRSRPDTTR